MRLAFMGTPSFAVPALDALHAAGHEIAAVYTQPPRPAGRGKALTPSPVQLRAESLGLYARAPASLQDEAEQQAFAALAVEVAIVAAYGLILPEPILAVPPGGCLNIHASLLPRWRGAAPIQRAILAGDERTGVCIMKMERGLDTGPVYVCEETGIDRKNAGELSAELAKMGARLMVETLTRLDQLVAAPQPVEGATYAAKIAKEEARLDFDRSAQQVDRQVRAFAPTPGSWFDYQGERIRVLAANPVEGSGPPGTLLDDELTIACRASAIRPSLVQRPGKLAMTVGELLRGFPLARGSQVG
jgi:methionyl-tRNA formyltransferase